ncbi:MAG TPA: GntR family transcriptional regulator [Candidatus Brocadiia bacterium]|nr:GntR family transcriptional regulator [Candidatus Brocadiia bacterium]
MRSSRQQPVGENRLAPPERPAPAPHDLLRGAEASLADPPAPLWRQLAACLASEARRLGPGARFPSERDLSARFGVQRATVQKALESLAAQHVLRREPCRGAFVEAASATAPIALLQFHIPSEHDEAYATHIRGVSQGLEGSGRPLLPSLVMPNGFSAEMLIDSLRATRAAGVIVDRFSVPGDVPLLRRIHAEFPMVSMSKELLEIPVPCVQVDPFESSAAMARYFLEKGCRTLAFYGRRSAHMNLLRRHEAFLTASLALGGPRPLVLEEAEDITAAPSWPRPVGVYAPLGREASRALKECSAAGMRLGRDLFIGVSPPAHGASKYPGMALAVRDEERLGREAARLMLRHLEGRADPREIVNVPATIVLPQQGTAEVGGRPCAAAD